jgi:hypothetical protein
MEILEPPSMYIYDTGSFKSQFFLSYLNYHLMFLQKTFTFCQRKKIGLRETLEMAFNWEKARCITRCIMIYQPPVSCMALCILCTYGPVILGTAPAVHEVRRGRRTYILNTIYHMIPYMNCDV